MAKPRRGMTPPADARMAAGGGRCQDGPASGQPDSLAQVQAEIDAFKAEALSGRANGQGSAPRPESVFACTGIDETGYGDLLDCICKDDEVHPQAICPQHGKVYD